MVTPRFATALTAVVVVAVLLAALGSVTPEVAVAVLEREAGAAAVTVATMVTVTELPLLMVPSEQLAVVVPVHVPALGVAETNVSPAGKVSVRFTAVAGDGPAFDTVTV
jgi:hypothetical protein